MMPTLSLLIVLAASAWASPVLPRSDADTASSEKVGWVPANSRRSTMDIVWTCFSIFIICSWRCLHFNLPTPEESRARCYTFPLWIWRVPYWPSRALARKWFRKLSWMGAICLAPEYGVATALADYIAAYGALHKIQKSLPRKEAQKYTMAHAHCTVMGGIAIRKYVPPDGHGDKPNGSKPPSGGPGMAGDDEDLDYFVCSLEQLSESKAVPTITEEDINDRSKSDGLTKTLAVVQCSWLIIHLIARVVQGLAITELELSTAAFGICALIMYILWWNKPFGMERRIVVVAAELPSGEPMCQPQKTLREQDISISDTLKEVLGFSHAATRSFFTFSTAAAGVVFTAVHVAAWNWDFPSPLVATLWRVFTLTAVGSSLVFGTCSLLVYTPWEDLDVALSMTMVVIYCVARVGILALTLYCFCSMPESVYEQVNWVQLLPHFS